MSLQNRTLTSSLRHPSVGGSQYSSGQPPALVARINEKRAELEDLKQLKDLSADLATQMQALQHKLATLSNGTEAVAAVLSNWHNVLRAINMASSKLARQPSEDENGVTQIPGKDAVEVPLPQILVRIPAQQQDDIPDRRETA